MTWRLSLRRLALPPSVRWMITVWPVVKSNTETFGVTTSGSLTWLVVGAPSSLV
jgi:hypothetical protein